MRLKSNLATRLPPATPWKKAEGEVQGGGGVFCTASMTWKRGVAEAALGRSSSAEKLLEGDVRSARERRG